jgi:dihydrolipoamide dehydrogenase
MAEKSYDLVVIGAGPGGYVAAIRAAQLGMSVACIDRRAAPGGTCLNIGCIPSKALLQSSEKYAETAHDLAAHGIGVKNLSLDLKTMLARKDEVVQGLTKGIGFLFKKYKVTQIHGTARIAGKDAVEVASVDGKNGKETIRAKRILIATGSESTPLPGVDVDEKRIVSSTGALSLASVPKHMVVIGGGYIGLEMGSVWGRLGAKVTVVEFLDRILPGMDSDVSAEMAKILKKQGMAFRLGAKVTGAKAGKAGVTLAVEPAKGGDAEEIACDVVLVAIGRRPHTDGLGLDDVGVTRDARGFIAVNARFETAVEGIYAIGDVIPGPMLAHKAMDEGHIVAEIMAGQAGHIDYDMVPGVVYTAPEAASVGRTEDQLRKDGVAVRVGKFPFMANSRVRASGLESAGFVKIIADAGTDRVLGAHIVGPDAGTMIAELVLAMEFQASAEDVARTCHAHPTLNEAVKEAALAAAGLDTIHL